MGSLKGMYIPLQLKERANYGVQSRKELGTVSVPMLGRFLRDRKENARSIEVYRIELVLTKGVGVNSCVHK